MCKTRRACGDCRSRPEWRKAMGAPEVCPFGDPPQTPVKASTHPDPEEIARRRAICAKCPYFGLSECCGCGEARKDPARELAACRWGFWPDQPNPPN